MEIEGSVASGTWFDEPNLPDYSNSALYRSRINEGYLEYNTGSAGDTIRLKASRNWTGETSSFGGSQAHNIMNPYHTCYIWRRTK